jgi:CHAT domain-containing protein/predicted negative regulator of RcsB-dependent stress response
MLVNGIVACLLVAVPAPAISPDTSPNALQAQAEEPQMRAYRLMSEGEALEKEGKFQEALLKFEEALQIFQAAGNSQREAFCLNSIGGIKAQLSDIEGARRAWEAGYKIWREKNNMPMAGLMLTRIGTSYEKQGNSSQAISYYQQSIEIVESSINEKVKIPQIQEILTKIQDISSPRLINLLWEAKRYPEAFNYVERAKARAFLDQLNHGPINFLPGNDASFLARERALKEEIERLRLRLRLRKEPDSQEVKDKLKEYEDLWAELQYFSREIASVERVDVAELSEIQKLLDADTTLVEYFVTGTRTLAFIITRNRLEAVALNVPQKDLENKIRVFGSNRLSTVKNLQALHKDLIAPLKNHLTTRTIGIVPHGQLHYLPFAALTEDGKRYLIDDHPLFTLPNASVLRFLPQKRKPKTGTVLALANRKARALPSATSLEKQVEEIASMYSTKPLTGNDATESALRSKAGQAEILHIAAHGEYKPDTPLFSTIYLSEDTANDGQLEVHEIYGLDLRKVTNLVVLSACQLQEGKLGAGDEVMAMNRAFMFAGTPSVIASLWQVLDEPTTLLMVRFYTHLKKGMGKAEALQQAQIEVRQIPKYRHPDHWAAFVLTGDWKN